MMLLVLLACAALAAADSTTAQTPTTNKPTNGTKEILTASETSDPSKVDIVKQIRRLNDDGSYTIGYEADDGTFKIESRDVRGNVKGTFGYIDKDGEIKRVTYSSSSDVTPVPVSTTTSTASTPTMMMRMNKTVPTARRPLPTVVYPTRSSNTLRSTTAASARRRAGNISSRVATTEETTTEKAHEETTSNILNLYKSKSEDSLRISGRSNSKDDLTSKASTTKSPYTIKPVYESTTEKEPEVDPNKANTIRRELTGTSSNPHMINLRQSTGDDSSDVYGSHQSLGTVRPLFTTTTPRARLVPIHSLVAARQKIQQQYQEIPVQEEETTQQASTGRVFDQENYVTSTPVPEVHIRPQQELDERIYQQPIYRRPSAALHFRTHEYLKDNPGAAVPIGNQRPFLHYELQNKVLEPQYVKNHNVQQAQTKESAPEAVTNTPYDVRPIPRIIPVHVDERGVPIQGYQPRFTQYRPAPPLVHPRYESEHDMNSIQAPVSTRDLRRLLQILILRQNRLQAIMDQLVSPGPPYQSLPPLRQQPEYDYRYQNSLRQYHDEDQYDYRYDQRNYRQQRMYPHQQSGYDGEPYESQRYVPRRRLYRNYDTASASSNHVDEAPEYLPPDIREALLLKMLLLAISPDYMPSPPPVTELTTVAPSRKQVRNIQILGEEGTTEMKATMQRH